RRVHILSAAGGGDQAVLVAHFAAFRRARRTRASRVASSPSSSSAAATAALASAGRKPRFWSADKASAPYPPAEIGMPPDPRGPAAVGATPILSFSSLTIRSASLGPTPLARATIA